MINIGNISNATFKVGSDDISIYLGEIKLYPTGSTCYEVISTPIASYISTTYYSVYSFADAKWYMLNNLSQYEEYGIYETGTSLSDFTYYLDKLVIVGETEYQYQTNGWVEVGEYIDAQTTYEVTDDSEALEGKELSTTFKIPYADVEALGGSADFMIRTEDGSSLKIETDYYRYMGSKYYIGTVTNDGEYYYFSLPSEAPSSVIIQETMYSDSTPIHLIFGSGRQPSVEYEEKEMPLSKVYNTVADMEAVGCPTVGVGQYGVVGDNLYQFEETEEWVNKAKSSLKLVAKYNDDNVNVIECNTSSELSTSDTQPSYLSKDAMTDAIIGDCVTSIGDSVFDFCTSLSSCTIGSGVTSIGMNAFFGCSGLTSIDIPSSVTSISQGAFSDCSSLTSIDIPDSVTRIDNNAFRGCRSLTSIDIPSGVTSISSGVFQGCRSLTSIVIPSGVTSIDSYAFRNCSGLTSVIVEATTPPTLGSNAFDNTNNCQILVPCESVKAYKSAANWSTYADRITCKLKFTATYSDGEIYKKGCDSSSLITTSVTKPTGYQYTAMTDASIGDCVSTVAMNSFSGFTSLSSVTISDNVTSLANQVFKDCISLTEVKLPSGINKIMSKTFENCTNLKNIDIPSGVTMIGGFENCTSLENITLPNALSEIYGEAFKGCTSLKNISIPSGVNRIGDYAFYECSGLTSITVNRTTPPTLGSFVFTNTNNCPIYVPASVVDEYKTSTSTGWNEYASRLQAIP